jgi:uncharacterized membrane protein
MTVSVSDASSDSDAPETKWDSLLTKYVRVWVWSVLFGTTSAVGYAFIGVRIDRPWGSLTVLPLVILIIGIAASLGAWTSLLAHLRLVIMPTFFGYVDYETRKRSAAENERRASQALLKSFRYFIIAGVSRLLLSLIEMAFELLRNVG